MTQNGEFASKAIRQ